MKNSELDQILRSAPGLKRSDTYWDEFPGRLMEELRMRQAQAVREGLRAVTPEPATPRGSGWLSLLRLRPIMGFAIAAVCIALGFWAGFYRGKRSGTSDPQLVEAQKCYGEIAALFPNQLQAIVLDPLGAQLVLSDRADVPSSAPLYLKICDAKGCRRFVTFSGQQIRVNGEVFDVLVSRQGEVLVVGQQWVWSSSQRAEKPGPYRIEARPLPAV